MIERGEREDKQKREENPTNEKSFEHLKSKLLEPRKKGERGERGWKRSEEKGN